MRKNYWLAISLLTLAACGSEDATVRTAPANRKPGYFDVKGFLDGQVEALNQRQPLVEKQVRLRDGKLKTTRVAKTDWAKELQIFYQADINKPALRGAYSKTTSASYDKPDGATTYKLTATDAKAPVVSLVVGSGGNGQDAGQEIAAVIRQNNALFYSEKRLRLSTSGGMLREYRVEGVQKLVLFDTVRYSVRTRVLE